MGEPCHGRDSEHGVHTAALRGAVCSRRPALARPAACYFPPRPRAPPSEQKKAVAVAYVKTGTGMIKVNGQPIELLEPAALREKSFEPVLLVGLDKFAGVDVRVRVRGGGQVAQIYAIRQAIAKAIVAWNQKYVDEQSKREIKQVYLDYDRSLLVADPRRCEPKKFGGRSARARFQKSYR